MSERTIKTKSRAFAKEVVATCQRARGRTQETVLFNRLLRSGTAIGANIHQAQYIREVKGALARLEAALKESQEAEYWLEILFECGCLTEEEYRPLHTSCGSLRRLLAAAVRREQEKQWKIEHLFYSNHIT